MKKIGVALLFLMGASLLWYLFIKQSDYIVRFEAKGNAGTINQTLKLWDLTLDTVQKIKQDGDLYHLRQKIKFGDSIHDYLWKIKPLTDSTSKVIVGIKGKNHSLKNRIQVPFQETEFKKQCVKTVSNFLENLKDHTDKIKVTVVGEEESPSKYFAYVPLKTTQFQKAGGMMRNYSFLTSELLENKVQLDGRPMIEITMWDRTNDSIYYNFGMPIIRSERLPIGTEIKYKRIFPKKALKAIYNGNYITSDRAWYALLDYAQSNSLEVDSTLIEVFHNNPNTGGDEENWKAEIYLPLK